MKRKSTAVLAVVAPLAALAALAAGCEDYFTTKGTSSGSADATSGDVSIAASYAGVGIGKACKAKADCRAGLDCVAGKCAANKSAAENASCLVSDECKAGLHCSWAGFCTPQPAGKVKAGAACDSSSDCVTGHFCAISDTAACLAGKCAGVCTDAGKTAPPEGEECTSTAGCPPGMWCESSGLSGTCKKNTGKADLGDPCKTTADCWAGLSCSKVRQQCVPGSLTLNPDLYGGVECRETYDAGEPFRALVEIPRTTTATDFYALPFPNDIRKKNGKVDLSEHPNPGLGFVGFDATQRIKDAITAEYDGFGLTMGFYVRFTRAVDIKTLGAVDAKTKVIAPAKDGAIRLYDATSGKQVENLFAHFSDKRNKYICGNWLYVHPRWSDLLEPKHTYVLIVTDAIKAGAEGNGTEVAQQGKDLQVLLAAAAPADAALKSAYDTYKPVRDLLPKVALLPGKVVAAAPFTTHEPRVMTAELALTAAKALMPNLIGPVLCDGKTVSPCGTTNFATTELGKLGKTDPRACPKNVAATHHEIHGKITLPVYQSGTRPYLDAGGALTIENGKPTSKQTEEVCISITIPKTGAMPAGGWPLVLFAHGTGGSFRSHVDGMAPLASNIQVEGGPVVRAATFGIDQPMHHNRRGQGIETDPGPLFYNFANPPAAKGNFYQGAADNYALFRWAVDKSKNALTLPGAGNVKFDANNLFFMGHSQGGTTGPMALPFLAGAIPAGLKGAVASGCGGSLVHGLLGKKLPYDASIGLRIGLQEMSIDEYHPVLNLFQYYFEPSDPLLYGELMYRKNVNLAAGLPWLPLHLLHTYGQGDNFTPPTTSRIFAAATGGTLATTTSPDQDKWFDKIADLGMKLANPPLANNVQAANGNAVTGVTIQAKNDPKNSVTGAAYDGHFVAFNDKTLNRQVLQFIGSAIAGTPKVVK
jgi:hypothetical protein